MRNFQLQIISQNPETIQFVLEDQEDEIQVTASKSEIHGKPDLILLDIEDSDLSPCERLRNADATRTTPILVMAESADPEFRALVFNAGADGYVQKPFNENELIAQVRARLRSLRTGPKQIQCGNLVLNIDNQEVLIDGKIIGISTLEFQLLHYFAENVGRLVTRKALLDTLWRDSVVSERTVDAHMAILRKKLAQFNYEFQTVYGSGYRLKETPEK